jgi:hypothetical protein
MDIININNTGFVKRIVKKITYVKIFSVILGGVLGFLFYYFTSCCSDEMLLNLNPYFTVLYGMIIGALISAKR